MSHIISTSGIKVQGIVGAKSVLIGQTFPGHEEVNTRIILHLKDMVDNGLKYIVIRSVDTDVLVLDIYYFFKLSDKNLETFWVAFNTGKKYRYIPVNAVASAIGRVKANSLLGFHSFYQM